MKKSVFSIFSFCLIGILALFNGCSNSSNQNVSNNVSTVINSEIQKNVDDSTAGEILDQPNDWLTPSDYVVDKLENTRSELERNIYVITSKYPDITQEQLDEILLAIEEAFPFSPNYEEAVIMGNIDPTSKLTLDTAKQIIVDALDSIENKSEISNYLFTVPDYIKNKIDEIQPIPNFTDNSSSSTLYYYCLDADDFKNCHQAIVLIGSAQVIVYEEYDDTHQTVKSEVLYDKASYISKLH